MVHQRLPVLPMRLHQPCRWLLITAEEPSHQQLPLQVLILPVPVRKLIPTPILIAAWSLIPGYILIPSVHPPWQCLLMVHQLLPVLPMRLHQPCRWLLITAEEPSHQQVPLQVLILPVPCLLYTSPSP